MHTRPWAAIAVSVVLICFLGCDAEPIAMLSPAVPAPPPPSPCHTACPNPAPLIGEPDPRAPRYIVRYVEGVDTSAETERLAELYSFAPVYVYTAVFFGFASELTCEVVASLRCEPTVLSVTHDSYETVISASKAPPAARSRVVASLLALPPTPSASLETELTRSLGKRSASERPPVTHNQVTCRRDSGAADSGGNSRPTSVCS